MDQSELANMIAKVRRDMPRNATVMALCEELERRATWKPDTSGPTPEARAKRNRYMRGYLPVWRAADKARKASKPLK